MNEPISDKSKDELISELGGMLLANPEYIDNSWAAFSIVVTIENGQRSMTGYRYTADGGFHPSLPSGSKTALRNKLSELQAAMAAETGALWHQCLVQVWRPGPEIKVLFEYDDPTRWDLKKISLDMSDYANSIKPAV